MSVDKYLLDRNNAALLIIDIQERLAVAMDKKEQVVRNTLHLVELAKMLNIPVVVTEQYPKGLGRTLPEITAALPAYLPIEKVSFNCCGEASFNEQMKRLGKKKHHHRRHGDAHPRAPDQPREESVAVFAAGLVVRDVPPLMSN